MKRIIIIGIVFCALFSTACKKYLDINENPSFPQLVKAELLLAPLIFQMANGYSQDQTIINKFTQSILGSSTDDASKIWERHGYRSQSDVGGVMWRMVYFNHGHNLQLLLDDAIANKKYEMAGMGYAIRAWGFQMLTDYHGPVILSEAFRPQQLKFKYDDQDLVYEKVREWCDSALYYFSLQSPVDYTGTLSSEKTDNLYRGNISKWKRFVYGIKATQLGHLINKTEFKTQYADSIIKYVDLSFESPADDAGVKFKGDDGSNSNVAGPKYGVYTSAYYRTPGKPIVHYLTGGLRGTPTDAPKTSSDPRLRIMLKMTPDSTYIGGEPNVTNTGIPSTLGYLVNSVYEGKFIFRDKVDFPIMTYAQLQLIKAEAQLIKEDKTGAYSSYINAIIGHMGFVNRYADATVDPIDKVITATEWEDYILKSGEIPTSASDLTLSDIMGQKYIVQWGWGGLEQWCDLRKYNYDPEIFKQYIPLSGSQLQYGKYCYRVRPRYNSEYVWNSEELEKWGGLDPEYITKPTWFVLPN